ncbi:MAG: molecular chaperone DnaJ [Synechococcus sp. SB0666_bin_14]|nr:molecular chaperone DnaJ [Synechococcus sp. SB0666_bin_14]MYA91514.1 molecular chaperone DnaJ [Synechococcus sp. SB0663_bin_10]MYG45925.1 molecular chaperone DnaJ [Synechococcus sp. SB0675_bin_6]MYJ59795.1 molecular chaperone DnaJ [Synechococcus sp. SB0672_bin_6]MYK91506.1 molecular chaperone DnaJ [Synechococcus sp. SB0669_bin_8]
MADYYDLLNVSRNADQDTLKRAYRRLARQYHPDVNREPGAEERFKEIGRAYEVLSDPEQRSRYDQFGEAGVGGAAGGMPDMGDMGGFADIFESFFGGGAATGRGSRRRQGPTQGDHLRLDLTISLREAVFGTTREVPIRHLETCTTCSGNGLKPGRRLTTCATCGGQGQVRRASRTPFGVISQVTTCPACGGRGQLIKPEDRCGACNGQGATQVLKKLRITIPRGVESDQQLRVAGEGNAGERGGPAGDLFVQLRVESDPRFQREGTTIRSTAEVSYLQAILGDTITVATVEGDQSIELPAGTQPGEVLTLPGLGVPKLGNPVARGDHLLTVKVRLPKGRFSLKEKDVPSGLSPEGRTLLKQLDKKAQSKVGRLGGFL